MMNGKCTLQHNGLFKTYQASTVRTKKFLYKNNNDNNINKVSKIDKPNVYVLSDW